MRSGGRNGSSSWLLRRSFDAWVSVWPSRASYHTDVGYILDIKQKLVSIVNITRYICWLSESGSTTPKLSTFSTGGSNKGGSNVQMRRTTNRRGKTAPAPPKRTRYEIDNNIRINTHRNRFRLSSLLSTSRDSTYRDEDGSKPLDDYGLTAVGPMPTNGTSDGIAKSLSCSSVLSLFRGTFFRIAQRCAWFMIF